MSIRICTQQFKGPCACICKLIFVILCARAHTHELKHALLIGCTVLKLFLTFFLFFLSFSYISTLCAFRLCGTVDSDQSIMSELSGKVQTVLGLVDPNQLGRTMTHEHLTMTFECCYFPPPTGDEAVAQNPFQMQHMHWLRQNPYSCHENLLLQQETNAVREELMAYKKAGGGTIVENTTTGIDRDLPTLRQLAKDTGVHIIAGAGYYVDCTHTEATKKMSVEKVWLSLRSSVQQYLH